MCQPGRCVNVQMPADITGLVRPSAPPRLAGGRIAATTGLLPMQRATRAHLRMTVSSPSRQQNSATVKKLLRTAPVRFLLTAVLAAYMHLTRTATRWTVVGREHVEPVWASGRGLVWCMWHSRMIGGDMMWPPGRQTLMMLTSLSREADISTRAIEWLGRRTVRGSTAKKTLDGTNTKGAIQAFRTMVEHARGGGCVGITPDGPRGPRMRAQPGAIRVAKAAGVPIVPSAWSIAGSRYLDTWDRMVLPRLLARGVLIYGAPIHVPRDADEVQLEALRQQLEDELTRLLNQADAMMGGPQIEPAALPAPVPAPHAAAS
jgi:lysophospholipid acyltransferase (LPLAT)-like uncharacterized protein